MLDAVLGRLRPGGAVVATYAALDRAAAAAARLGHLVQVAVSRGVPIGEHRVACGCKPRTRCSCAGGPDE